MAGKFWPTLEDNQIERIVSLSIDGGINWFDTAEVYGRGESEKALSKALKAAGKKPGEVIDLYQVHQPWSFSGENSEMAMMAELYK